MDWIRKQARLYANLALMGRYQAVVHLENKEDETFWDAQLQKVRPGRYRYLYYSKSAKGTDSRGCEQCLRFMPYLTNHFFICIDSDLRLLRGEVNLTASNHVAQTYAYSWENHLCEAFHLCHRAKQAADWNGFDMKAFIMEFSKIVRRPLLYLVHYSNDSRLNKQWNISKFNACIPLQPKPSDLECNGRAYLADVRQRFNKALATLAEEPSDVPTLTDGNAYLHMQGHHLYKLLLHVGTWLCKGQNVAFKTDILDQALPTSGYEEIDALQSDLHTILKPQ